MSKEFGVVRMELSGPEAAPYTGLARNLLGIMKNMMQLGKLDQNQMIRTLEDGTQIVVTSIYGQDKIMINKPVKPVKALEVTPTRLDIRGEAIYGDANIDLFEWSRGSGLVLIPASTSKHITAVSVDGTTIVGYDNVTGGSFYKKGNGAFTGIGSFLAEAVSGDGRVLAGSSGLSSAIWTATGGIESIGDGSALEISEDGTVVTGYTAAGNAYRWTRTTGLIEVGSFLATGISADGTTIFGDDAVSPVIWTQAGGAQTIALPASIDVALPRAISEDGKTLVGTAFFSDGGGYPHEHVFRWTQVTGFEILGALYTDPILHNDNQMAATGVNYNGSVIVGQGIGMTGVGVHTSYQSFRWTQANGFESLGVLSGRSAGTTVIASPRYSTPI